MERRVVVEKKKINKAKIVVYFMGFFLIFIMIGGSITMRGENSEEIDYNGIVFQRTEYGWMGYKGEEKILLLNSPLEADNVSVVGSGFNNLNSLNKLYISTNPEENIRGSLNGLSRNIAFKPPIFNACFDDFEGCEEIPIKTCDDASILTGVIIFRTGENSTINFKNNCLVVEGKEEDMGRVIDKLVLKWKGL